MFQHHITLLILCALLSGCAPRWLTIQIENADSLWMIRYLEFTIDGKSKSEVLNADFSQLNGEPFVYYLPFERDGVFKVSVDSFDFDGCVVARGASSFEIGDFPLISKNISINLSSIVPLCPLTVDIDSPKSGVYVAPDDDVDSRFVSRCRLYSPPPDEHSSKCVPGRFRTCPPPTQTRCTTDVGRGTRVKIDLINIPMGRRTTWNGDSVCTQSGLEGETCTLTINSSTELKVTFK